MKWGIINFSKYDILKINESNRAQLLLFDSF